MMDRNIERKAKIVGVGALGLLGLTACETAPPTLHQPQSPYFASALTPQLDESVRGTIDYVMQGAEDGPRKFREDDLREILRSLGGERAGQIDLAREQRTRRRAADFVHDRIPGDTDDTRGIQSWTTVNAGDYQIQLHNDLSMQWNYDAHTRVSIGAPWSVPAARRIGDERELVGRACHLVVDFQEVNGEGLTMTRRLYDQPARTRDVFYQALSGEESLDPVAFAGVNTLVARQLQGRQSASQYLHSVWGNQVPQGEDGPVGQSPLAGMVDSPHVVNGVPSGFVFRDSARFGTLTLVRGVQDTDTELEFTYGRGPISTLRQSVDGAVYTRARLGIEGGRGYLRLQINQKGADGIVQTGLSYSMSVPAATELMQYVRSRNVQLAAEFGHSAPVVPRD
ncbi:hypothetical protein GF342_02925 [Candidatus Woesearchaeota archaeon]|nr:hypothetical protein [Candidatus Woesearchaeota archaeon]